MDATISAIATIAASSSNQVQNSLNLQDIVTPFVQYLLSPAIIGLTMLWGFNKIFKLGELRQVFINIQKDVTDLKTKSGSIINNVTVIKTHLVDKSGVNASLFQTMSPITLTPAGQKLIKDIGFDTFVNENYDEIEQYFTENSPDTLFKLDELSEVLVEDYFNANRLPSYENEAFKRGISTDVLLRACSLYLRNFMAKKLSITE